MEPRAYRGELEVQPDDFSLFAKQFIVREQNIALILEGDDDYGEFDLEGSLDRNESNEFGGTLRCVYRQYGGRNSSGFAILTIHRAIADPDSCEVFGSWSQERHWTFRGKLKRYRPSRGR